MITYTLQNAEVEARRKPREVAIPELTDRQAIPDGDWARLGFVKGDSVEYKWVRVSDRESANGTYYGVLDDGGSIQFEAENVFEILKGE